MNEEIDVTPTPTYTLLNMTAVNMHYEEHALDNEHECPECNARDEQGRQWKGIQLGDSVYGIVPKLIELDGDMYLEHITKERVTELQKEYQIEEEL